MCHQLSLLLGIPNPHTLPCPGLAPTLHVGEGLSKIHINPSPKMKISLQKINLTKPQAQVWAQSCQASSCLCRACVGQGWGEGVSQWEPPCAGARLGTPEVPSAQWAAALRGNTLKATNGQLLDRIFPTWFPTGVTNRLFTWCMMSLLFDIYCCFCCFCFHVCTSIVWCWAYNWCWWWLDLPACWVVG